MFRWLRELLFPVKKVVPIIPDIIEVPLPSIKPIMPEPVKSEPLKTNKDITVTGYPISPVCIEALKIAKTQLGIKEEKNNRGPAVKAYLKSVDLNEGNSWCMAFVYWCFMSASRNLMVPNPCTKTAGVLHHWQITKGIKVKMPRPGDIFIIDHGKGLGHTGFVKTVDKATMTYTTIEGNSNTTGSREGTMVCSNSRQISAALGFIRY